MRIPQIFTLIRKLFERNYRYLQTRYEKGCKSRNNLIYTLYCGAYGTRTRDPMRDRHVF